MQKLDWIILAISLVLAWIVTGPGAAWLRLIERSFGAVARRKRLAVMTVGAATVLTRLALLPWFPVPEASQHDEFSYLLAADTFAHARLANLPHPMWRFFDTFHVLQHPTYASMYPPAQGIALAVGELLGNPWFGVLLSTGAMCMALTWMLQGWASAEWALLGGVLAWCQFGIFSYWMNSYWGGSVAATGGALLTGALPRIFRRKRARDAVICGIGAAILANSRPVEGGIFFLPIGLAILLWWIRGEKTERGMRVRQVILPLGIVLALTAGLVAKYNDRVTGSATTFPEALELSNNSSVAPLFVWQHAKPQTTFPNQQFEDFYNENLPRLSRSATGKAVAFWKFFVGPGLCAGLFALPLLFFRERLVRLLILQLALCGLGLCAVTYFFPHYAAPAMASLVVLLTLGLAALSRVRLWGFAAGTALVAAAVIYTLVIGPVYFMAAPPSAFQSIAISAMLHVSPQEPFRRAIEHELKAMPGEHLVLVYYGECHDPGAEYVYNEANIDRARIVWARGVRGQDVVPLLNYFPNRDVWVFEPDDGRLYSYIPN